MCHHCLADLCIFKNIYFVCDKNRFLKEYLIGKLVPGSICNKLIKVDIAKKIQFPVGKIYEDAFYQFDLINFAKKYVVTTNPMYNLSLIHISEPTRLL